MRGVDILERKSELIEIVKKINKEKVEILTPIIEEIIFLEKQLEHLRDLPMIKIHPTDPTKQKQTPAAKQYKDMANLYSNYVKTLLSVFRNQEDNGDELHQLQKFLQEKGNFNAINISK